MCHIVYKCIQSLIDVRVLLLHGVWRLVDCHELNGNFFSFHCRFALLDAMRKGHTSVIELYVQCNGFTQFLPMILPAVARSTSPEGKSSSSLSRLFLREFSFGLYVLASKGNFSLVMDLLRQMNDVIQELLLMSTSSVRVFYLSVCSMEGEKLGKWMMQHYMAILCKSVLRNDGHSLRTSPVIDAVFEKLVELFTCGFVKAAWDDIVSLALFLQLLQYCVTYYKSISHKKCSLFHALCGWGCTDLVRLILASPSGPPLIALHDAYGRSPLYYAASGGHLDLVRSLLEHGASLKGKNGFHPLLAALAYLGYASLAYYFNCTRSPFKWTFVNPRHCIKTHAVLSNYLEYFQGMIEEGVVLTNVCHPCKLFADVNQSRELVQLVTIPSSDDAYCSHAVWYLKLLFILPDLKPVNSLISGQFMSSLASSSNETLRNFSLDEVFALVPASHCHQSPELFRKMLTTFIPKVNVKNVAVVALKGYGDLLLGSAMELSTSSSTQCLELWCEALLTLLRNKNLGTVSRMVRAIFPPDNVALINRLSHYISLLLTSSVKHQLNDVLTHLLRCNIQPSQVMDAVKYAAESGNDEALSYMLDMPHIRDSLDDNIFATLACLSAKRNRRNVIQYLCESKWCEDRTALWRTVLFTSAENGKEKLALEAVANIPFSHIMSLQSDPDFTKLVYYCCWWGMVDLLESLGIENSRVFLQACYGVTPLEAAAGNKQINKISPFVCTETCTTETIATFFSSQCSWPDLISTGWLDVVCNGRSVGGLEREHFAVDPYQRSAMVGNLSAFGAAMLHGVESVVRAFISCWGCFAGLVISTIEKIPKYSIISKVCQSRNYPVLQLVLKTLFEANLLKEVLAPKHVCMVINAGNVDCVRFVLSVATFDWSEFIDPVNNDNILHWVSECHVNIEEIVQLVLSFVDSKDLPRLAVKTNKYDMTALESAISLGNRHLACQILQYANSIEEDLVKSLVPTMLKAFGWFHLLMQNNSSLRHSPMEVDHNAVDGQSSNSHGIKASLCCTYGQSFCTPHTLCSVEVLDFILQNRSKLPRLDSSRLFSCLMQTAYVVSTIRCNMQARVVRFFDEFAKYTGEPLHQQIDMEEVFESACLHGADQVLGYLLDLYKDQLGVLDDDTISNGFADAVAFGKIETACLLALKSDIPVQNLEKEVKTIRGVSVPPIVDLVLFSSPDAIVDALCSPSSRERHLSLADVWLMHKWGPHQCDFLRAKLCEVESTIESHVFQLKCKGSHIQLVMDWDSFKNHINFPIDQNDFPLKLQAMVLSAVFSHMFGKPPLLKFSSLFPDSTFDRVTISCVSYSQPASVTSNWCDGTILVSYNPIAKVLIFPEVGTSPFLSQSPLASPADLLFALPIKEKLTMLAISCTALLKTAVKTRVISFSDEFSKLSHDLYSCLEPVVGVCINDVASAVILSSVPVAMYTEAELLPLEFRQMYPFFSSYFLPMRLFSEFRLSSDILLDESTDVTAVVDSDTLEVCLTFVAREEEDEVCFTAPSHETILSEIASCLLTVEAEALKERLSLFLAGWEKKLCYGRTKLNCLLSGSDSELSSLADASQQHLFQLKLLPLIQRFINCFLSLINMSGQFLNILELNIVLLAETFGPSSFDRKRNTIFISPADMLAHNYQYRSMELIAEVFSRTSGISSQPSFVAPIFSMNWEQSLEFLYPTIGSNPMHGALNLSSAVCEIASSLDVSNVITPVGEQSYALTQSSSFGSIELCWHPPKAGQVTLFSSFSEFPMVNSSVRLMVGGEPKKWEGSNSVTLDQSLVFVTQHPFGGCTHHRKPARVLLSNRVPIHELVCAAKSENQGDTLMSALSKEPVHYISALSASRGKNRWVALPCGEVAVLVGGRECLAHNKVRMKAVSMGSGLTRVEVSVKKSGTYFIMAACSRCHAVMKVLWKDHASFLAQKCTLSTGRLSDRFSYITDQRPRNLKPCSTRTLSSGKYIVTKR